MAKKKRKPSAAFMKPMKPSAALGAVIGNKPMPRTQVTKKLWAYIKQDRDRLRRRARGPSYFFLKRLSSARRASSGRAEPDEASRSTVTCSEKNVHSLRAPLLEMRSGTGWVHSKCWPGSKWAHCRQEWSSDLHLGHWPSESVRGGSSVPQSVQRETVRV